MAVQLRKGWTESGLQGSGTPFFRKGEKSMQFARMTGILHPFRVDSWKEEG